jgi:hypothetical protein
MILINMILIAENRAWTTTYPVAPEPVALVDIAPVGIVVPLDTVQRGCSAYLPLPPRTPGRRWDCCMIEQSRSRSLKTWLPVFTWADELTNGADFGGMLSLFPCLHEPGREDLATAEAWMSCTHKRDKRLNVVLLLSYSQRAKRAQPSAGDQESETEETLTEETPVIMSGNSCNSCH